jgi:hypothetical protein
MEWEVALNNTSFDRVNITKDCKEAVCEYIWNGFEAGATTVEVSFNGEAYKEAMSLQIADDGEGIIYSNLKETFGAFLSSIKESSSIRIKSKINKGKGRFSYLCFSPSARWTTVYADGGVLKEYTISMDSSSRGKFVTSVPVAGEGISKKGTIVELSLSEGSQVDQLSLGCIKEKLLQEFSWYLYLNKNKKLSLIYSGIALDYKQHIDVDLSIEQLFECQGQSFKINLIVWQKNIDNHSKIYYLAHSGDIHAAKNTGFNNNTVSFFHSVFVESSFINAQNILHMPSGNADTGQQAFDEGIRSVFDSLNREITKIISEALRKFLLRQADEQISEMDDRGSMPNFPSDEYGQLRRKDFELVTKELYCIEPKIFYKLNPQQEKSLLGFMNLLLSSYERENILSIIEHIVNLTDEQRKNFADILQRTKLQYILEAISIIDKRLAVIDQLKRIVFELAKFANERNHVQKIVEQHFWLFGEQYHMLTADKTLATSLAEYEQITDTQQTSKTKRRNNKKELNQRADIFLYTKRVQEDSSSEMLIVELKAPSVPLSIDVFNQVVRYANTIRKVPQFSGTNRKWRFYAICSTVEDDVKVKYKNFVQHGKNGLVDVIEDNFEIYALSWDDVFQSFEARHSFLLEKLKIDYTQVSSEIKSENNVTPSRSLVNDINERLTTMQAR